MTRTVTCPHCGRMIGISNLGVHVGICPRNPAVHVRVAAVLADPDRPGYAVTWYGYDAAARPQRLPSRESLRREYGNWTAVCTAFGLRPVNLRMATASSSNEAQRLAALDAEVAAMQAAAEPANPYREWSGLPVCGVREIDGGRRLAWMVR